MVTNSDQPPETGLAPAPELRPREEGLAPGVYGCQSGLSSTLVLITWGTACHLASSPTVTSNSPKASSSLCRMGL